MKIEVTTFEVQSQGGASPKPLDPQPIKDVDGPLEGALKLVRVRLRSKGFRVRSVNHTKDGSIFAYVLPGKAKKRKPRSARSRLKR